MDPLAEKVHSVNPYAYADNNPGNNIDPNGMETLYGLDAQNAFRQLQSKYSSRPPDEYNVDGSGNATKVSDKGGHLYDYYNFASGYKNPISGKTLAVGAISGEILDIAKTGEGKTFYVPTGPSLSKIDNDYFFDGLAVGGAVMKPLAAGLSKVVGMIAGRFGPATAEELALVQANRAAGNAFRDELAAALQAKGREVTKEVYKWTPFGKRFIDIEVSYGGKVLGGIETKVGSSRYSALQRIKDIWSELNTKEGYSIQLVRKP